MPINLKELANAFASIENDFDENRYVDTRDGKIHFFRSFDEDLDEEGDDEGDVDRSADYIKPFPGKYEFRDYDLMEQFAQLQPSVSNSNALMDAIRGKGAFRKFRSTAERLGLVKEWYDYQEKSWINYARRWCHKNDVDYEPKLPEYSYRAVTPDDLGLVTDLLCKLYLRTKSKINERRAELHKENRAIFPTKPRRYFCLRQ